MGAMRPLPSCFARRSADARSRFVGRLEVAKVALEKKREALALDVAELLLPR